MKKSELINTLNNALKKPRNFFAWNINLDFEVNLDDFLSELLEKLFKISNLIHHDLIIFNSINLQNITQIHNFLSKKSENFRVIIIKNADKITKNTCNAFLKILEESSKIVFIFTSINNLIDTISSRLQNFYLHMHSDNNNELNYRIQDNDIYSLVEFYEKNIDLFYTLLLKKVILLYENNLNFEKQEKISDKFYEIIEKTIDIDEFNCNKRAFILSYLPQIIDKL